LGLTLGLTLMLALSLSSFGASTRDPPHEQWLMGLGAGAWACPSFGCGSHFVGHEL